MEDVYEQSWELYKAHTESFFDDHEYYSNFINGQHSLELFAGFGRITNRLLEEGHSIETVEIKEEFASFINLPIKSNHICDVLIFKPNKTYSRIFAAYNSFCLLTRDSDISHFFSNLGSWLSKGGLASLNYYHPDFWEDAVKSEFISYGKRVEYIPDFDLSGRYSEKVGVWIDHFRIHNETSTFRYVTKVYESAKDLAPFLEGTGLRIVDSVENFNRMDVTEPGWIDFILEKA